MRANEFITNEEQLDEIMPLVLTKKPMGSVGPNTGISQDKMLTPGKKISLVFYLLMGWLIVFAGDGLINTLNSSALYWLIAGGVIYTVGALFYANKRIPYNHAIWHIFVLFASACHFISVYRFILPAT